LTPNDTPAEIVYREDSTPLLVIAALVPMALTVVVAATLIPVVYVVVGELLHVPGVDAPGVLPSMV
jgi:hypothetical protein